MLDLDRLHTLLEVSKTGSFSRAAKNLILSQPTVWTHIHQLEGELGIALVERLGRRIHLTPAANTLLPAVRRAIEAARQVELSAAELRGDTAGSLRVGAGTTPGLYLVPPLLAELRKRRPQVALHFQIANSSRIPQLLLDNVIDVGFTGGEVEHPLLTCKRVGTDAIVLVGSPARVAEVGKTLKPAAMGELPVLFREPGSATRRRIEEWYRGHGAEPKVTMELEQPELIARLAAEGVGCAFVPRLSVMPELESGKLVEIRAPGLPLKRGLYCVRHRDKPETGAGAELPACLAVVVERLGIAGKA